MQLKSLTIGKVGTITVEIPYLEIGSGQPTGTLLAVQHGGEWSPLWVIKEFLAHQTEIKGTARIIPVANPFGFIAGARNETIEGKDLNRQYPGNAQGDLAARLANAIFKLCALSDFVIDLHTFDRQAPFLAGYADQNPSPQIKKIIQLLSPDIVWVADEKQAAAEKFQGTLYEALTKINVPSIFVEMPNYTSITPEIIKNISQGLLNVFVNYSNDLPKNQKSIPAFTAKTLYPDTAGLFIPLVKPLEVVIANQPIGELYTLPEFKQTFITTPSAGTIITIKGYSVVRTGSRLASIGQLLNEAPQLYSHSLSTGEIS